MAKKVILRKHREKKAIRWCDFHKKWSSNPLFPFPLKGDFLK